MTSRDITVVVADDDATWRAVLATWLEREGFRVVGLTRGEWVTGAIETHRADVLILNVHLPALDGLEVLRSVRYRWPQLPVIVTTAFGGADTAELARSRGATGYLEKPFRMGHLLAELHRIVTVPEDGSPGPRMSA